MNDINKIVMDIFEENQKPDYKSDISFIKKIKKMLRFMISGYIFRYKKDSSKAKRLNVFNSTNNVYKNEKICIYTVCIGKYDSIKNPIYYDENIDYYIFTDQEISNDLIWKKINIKNIQKISGLSLVEKTRYVKMHPEEFFSDYSYSVYIDSNVRVACDIKPLVYSLIDSGKFMGLYEHPSRNCVYQEAKAIYAVGKSKLKYIRPQIKQYKSEGFPKKFGLFENNIIIRRHNDYKCIEIMNAWWNELLKYKSKRDQLCLVYCLWKHNFSFSDVFSLGNNSRKNPYFIVKAHS